jgi:uncharacterized protein
MKTLLRSGLAVLAIAGLLTAKPALASNAAPAPTGAQLIVEDGAKFFTPAKIEEAKAIVAQSMGQGSRQVHVETYESLAPAELDKFKGAADKTKFWHDWAISKTKGDRGVSIFIVKTPPRYEVLVDRQMHDKGFNDAKESDLKKLIREHLEATAKAATPEAKQTEFDAALIDIANFMQGALPSTTRTTGKSPDGTKDTAKKDDANNGSGIGKYICIGICVLLGIWLVVGLIRAFSGGGGGGGAGGGGGGFMSGLLGGLFGAMAGMWLYNSVFGGHDSSAFGGDSSGGDYGGEAGGAGDYGGDTGSGGDYGGGGDTGGGGGDWGGGGGDTGGGGGDW